MVSNQWPCLTLNIIEGLRKRTEYVTQLLNWENHS